MKITRGSKCPGNLDVIITHHIDVLQNKPYITGVLFFLSQEKQMQTTTLILRYRT